MTSKKHLETRIEYLRKDQEETNKTILDLKSRIRTLESNVNVKCEHCGKECAISSIETVSIECSGLDRKIKCCCVCKSKLIPSHYVSMAQAEINLSRSRYEEWLQRQCDASLDSNMFGI
jgi:hypothetical protein